MGRLPLDHHVYHQLHATHRKVNYDSGKEVFPAGGAGRYEARSCSNRADSALQDVVIHDIIPGAFELLEWKVTSSHQGEIKCDMAEEGTTDGKKMSWNIGTVGKGERIEVIYEFKGDPEAGFKVSDAQEIHGIDVGEEIDDDENDTVPLAEENVEETTEEIDENASDAEDVDDETESSDDETEEASEETEEIDESETDEDMDESSDDETEDSDDAPSESSDEDDEMMPLAKITGASTPSESESSEARACPI